MKITASPNIAELKEQMLEIARRRVLAAAKLMAEKMKSDSGGVVTPEVIRVNDDQVRVVVANPNEVRVAERLDLAPKAWAQAAQSLKY